MKTATCDAALFAGGKSTRFGEDKAFTQWRGELLWVSQLRKLLSLEFGGEIWLCARSGQSFPDHIEGVTRLNDDPGEDLGPIGALRGLLKKSKADRILVLAVDLPLMHPEWLAAQIEAEPCRVPRFRDRWEPLAGAVYPRKDILPILKKQIDRQELSLSALVAQAEDENLIIGFDAPESSAFLFSNINGKEDLEAIQQGTVDDRSLLNRYRKGSGYGESEFDALAVEEPLEIRVNQRSVAVTMRTPGHDEELATGFLFTENIIASAGEIIEIGLESFSPAAAQQGNTIEIRIGSETKLEDLTRHVFTSSSCGICGKATIDAVFLQYPPLEGAAVIDPEIVLSLPGKLRAEQEAFGRTGGLHASGLFSAEGNLLLLREDVGRHNAVDKVIGAALQGEMDLGETILLVSGRVSFELMQKALAAKIPAVAGISAPSSLAVDLARRSGQVLIGFLREKGFNLYNGKLK